MQQADDLALSSKWSITFHNPNSPELYASSLGAFSTISGFWELYGSMLDNKILTNLPVTVNISVYRESANQCTKPWHGEWNIDLHHDTNPMRIYQQIILLAIGEQLTSQIRGLVLERRHDYMHPNKTHFSLSIFTDVRDPDLDIKNVLLSNNVISLNHCVSGKITFRPFQLLHIPTEHGGEEQKDEESIDSQIPCIKYSMASLLKYKESINNRSQSTHESSVTAKSRSRSVSPSTHSFQSSGTVLQPTSRHNQRIQRPVLPDFKHRESVLRLFGSHCGAYNLNVVSVHDVVRDQLEDILMSEGCIVCMGTTWQSPYSQNKENKDVPGASEEEKERSPVRDTQPVDCPDSFLVAECSVLGCKHVAHCECIAKAVNHISIRRAHCSQFFETLELSSLSNPEIQKEIGYHINTEHVTGKNYNFSFRINHLISHNSQVSPQWPISVPSYFLQHAGPGTVASKRECLQIFFDNTELQIRRGTLQIAIAESTEDAGQDTFLHTVNFEVPPPPHGFDVDPKITNKIYQLRYVDPQTHQVLVVNINMKLRPNYGLQLLSLRYEFNRNKSAVVQPAVSLCSEVASSPALNQADTESLVSWSPAPSISMMTLPDPNPLISPAPSMLSLPVSLGLPHPLSFGISAASTPLRLQSVPIATTASNFSALGSGLSGLQIAMSSLNMAPIATSLPAIFPALSPVTNLLQPLAPIPMVPIPAAPLIQQNPPRRSSKQRPPIPVESAFTALPSDVDDNPMSLYFYVCTEHGVKYVCEKVQNPLFFSQCFEKLKNFFPLLMMHHLGHTVCRAIYSQRHCTMRHKLLFLQSLALSFTKIASNRQGSFALICVLSLMTTDSELQVIGGAFTRIVASSVDGTNDEQFDEIILSQSGYHVIKKLVSFGHPHFECILRGIATDFSKYATHHYGVPIIRSILDLIAADDALLRRYRSTLQLFASHTPILVTNQYGNYVIQQLIDISPRSVTDIIKDGMRGQYPVLAKHKFASNVIEKCLKHSLAELKGIDPIGRGLRPSPHREGSVVDPQRDVFRIHHPRVNIVDSEQKEDEMSRTIWVHEILGELLADAPELINHKFGNYCLQTALSVTIEGEPFMAGNSGMRLLHQFVDTVSPLLGCLRQNVRKKWHQFLVTASSLCRGSDERGHHRQGRSMMMPPRHRDYQQQPHRGRRRNTDRSTFRHHY